MIWIKLKKLKTKNRCIRADVGRSYYEEGMDISMNKMKNGGYDHTIKIFMIMVNIMSPLILEILNILLYVIGYTLLN